MHLPLPLFRLLLLVGLVALQLQMLVSGAHSYYSVLEIPEGTDDVTVIKAAYKKLALKYHPDKSKENKAMNEEKLVRINEAYEHLVDHEKRKKYRYEQERTSSMKRAMEKSSPMFKKLYKQTHHIWNEIPIEDRMSLSETLVEYFKSDSARRDVSLLFTEGGVLNGALRIGLLVVTVTGELSNLITVLFYLHSLFLSYSRIHILAGVQVCLLL